MPYSPTGVEPCGTGRSADVRKEATLEACQRLHARNLPPCREAHRASRYPLPPSMIDRPRILLGYYEAISRTSHVMLGAALRGDWRAFEHAHGCCEQLIACLEATGITHEALDGNGRRRRMEILRQVLADDARIRDIAHPSLRRLDTLLAGRRLAALEESLAP